VTDRLHILDLATVLYRILRTEVPALRTELKADECGGIAECPILNAWVNILLRSVGTST
jgi:hypothetical protein